MYVLTQASGRSVKGVTEFYCDTIDDVANLPTEGVTPGSTAIVIASGQVFILNCSYQWVEFGGANPTTNVADAMNILELDSLVE